MRETLDARTSAPSSATVTPRATAAPWRERMRSTIGPGILAGIDLRDWAALLRDNHWSVDARYWPRAYNTAVDALLSRASRPSSGRLATKWQVYPPHVSAAL